ncbi:hypothetical protein MC885_008857 [Smutsia gigantea]|nr:hypothetical protein MC885_008857 [Smutsia gigantea]
MDPKCSCPTEKVRGEQPPGVRDRSSQSWALPAQRRLRRAFAHRVLRLLRHTHCSPPGFSSRQVAPAPVLAPADAKSADAPRARSPTTASRGFLLDPAIPWDMDTSSCVTQTREGLPGCIGAVRLPCLMWLLHLCWLLQMQRVQMHLVQEELLFLLPRGLCQVCPGLHLQRGVRQVQLLCLTRGRARSPCEQSSMYKPGCIGAVRLPFLMLEKTRSPRKESRVDKPAFESRHRSPALFP